ncbi:ShET2/EspL2 family type III secretion system effector toxin [Candidatus Ichthyocystis sparus]|uniref:ShET2/EspL2 family type III secretion system effector toxin n=1 Tax=Candidatus Ichthyocystis sparus TaxID=1561004 RepID=UPI00159EEDEA|nr:ShET2/EspL2 family type III secretion system effector toxin [Candidatus Ichthyocystis sparus]
MFDVHLRVYACSLDALLADDKSDPYISGKYVSSIENLNSGIELNGKAIGCTHLSSLYMLKSIELFNNGSKFRVHELLGTRESIESIAPDNIDGICDYLISRSHSKYVVVCDRFGNFLHEIARDLPVGRQRVFLLGSCNHLMSFRLVHKSKVNNSGEVVSSYVVHFFDPNSTNVVARSEVSDLNNFLLPDKFSLRKFFLASMYGYYFENTFGGPREDECVIHEYSEDEVNNSKGFLKLETLSQDGVSECLIYHVVEDGGSSCIAEVSRRLSLLSLDGESSNILYGRGSDNTTALHMALSCNRHHSIAPYISLLDLVPREKLASLLLGILLARSHCGVPGLFIALQEGHAESVRVFGLLLDKLVSLNDEMDSDRLATILFDILMSSSNSGASGLFMAMQENCSDAISAFGGLVDKLLSFSGKMPDSSLAKMIFDLLLSSNNEGVPSLFIAMQEGCAGAVSAFGNLIERLLFFSEKIPASRLAKMIFDLLLSSNNDGVPSLFIAMQEGCAGAVSAFGGLMDILLLFLQEKVSADNLAKVIFCLLMAKRCDDLSCLLMSIYKGGTSVLSAFACLLDRLLSLRDKLSGDSMKKFVFDLLTEKDSNGKTGLFVAMSNGYAGTVHAFGDLLDRFLSLETTISNTRFTEMVSHLLIARSDYGMTALSSALENNHAGAVIAYLSLLRKINESSLPDILVAIGSKGFPSVLSSNKETMEAYLTIITQLPSTTSAALISKLKYEESSYFSRDVTEKEIEAYQILLHRLKEHADSVSSGVVHPEGT